MTVKSDIKTLMQPGVRLTADEIAGALDLPVLSVRPRVCDLVNYGFLKSSGTKANRRGNNMTVWEQSIGSTA